MRKLDDAELENLSWCDANYYGHFWDHSCPEPTLILRVEPANEPVQELICLWATELSLDIQYGSRVGPLLTTEVAVTK
jgi:hypothetical protein